jgi:hypothetical protein
VNARRFASLAGTTAVTTIAAVASYAHMRDLALTAGQSPLLAALLPISVDGMMLVATVALGDGRRSKWSAWAAFLVGVAASLAANVMAAGPDMTARVVSAWPAVALLLTVEVLARSGRAPEVDPVAAPVPAADVASVPVVYTAKVPGMTGGTAARVSAIVTARPDVTSADIAAEVGCSPRTARRHISALRAASATA